MHINELIFDTVQGEGIKAGLPVSFIRVQGCSRHCAECDTKRSWQFKTTNDVPMKELIETLLKKSITHNYVITGGEPLDNMHIQQVHWLIAELENIPDSQIHIETSLPDDNNYDEFAHLSDSHDINFWSVSPKLSSMKPEKKIDMSDDVPFMRRLLWLLAMPTAGQIKFVVHPDSFEKDLKEILLITVAVQEHLDANKNWSLVLQTLSLQEDRQLDILARHTALIRVVYNAMRKYPILKQFHITNQLHRLLGVQ